MKEYNEKLNLGKGSAFVKSRLSRLPRTDEVWEADIQPISVWGWDARHHGELWLGMVLTQTENFHLALLASEARRASTTLLQCWISCRWRRWPCAIYRAYNVQILCGAHTITRQLQIQITNTTSISGAQPNAATYAATGVDSSQIGSTAHYAQWP